MSHQSEPEPSNFTILFERALEEYEIHTGEPWKKHPLARQLEQSYSLESVEGVLQEQAQAFTQSGGSNSKIVKSLKSAIPILYKLSTSTILRDAISVPFPFAKPILIAFSSLLGAAKDVIASHDDLANLLELIGQSVGRLHIYTTVTLHGAMVDFIVKMVVQVLHVLGLVTREIKRKSWIKIGRKLLKEKDIEMALQKLDQLRLAEVPTTAALILKHTDGLVKGEEEMRKMLQQIASDMNTSKRDKLAADLRSWLSPPDPGKNQDEQSKLRHPGTAAWFLDGETYSKWKSSEQSSLLWIHGKPGAGKSVLCSAIIQHISDMRKSQPAILTFYYCDFKEERKRDLRGLLSSLLVQLCHQSDSYCDILSKFFKDHTNGSQRANDAALVLCLKNILGHPRQHPVYMVVDALDECPNPPVRLTPRKEVLHLFEVLVDSIPNLRICMTSRPETDIELVLNRLTSYTIALHGERRQIDDINGYITWFVNNDEGMQGWTREVKQHVIDVLTRKADGMFRWVDCQLPYLRDCPPSDIQEVLDDLPETLNETYERALREIKGTHKKSAHRLFQCIAVASRPLRVKELAEVFAFDFSAHPVPKFRKDWRQTDPVHAVLSACSSLLTIVNVEDTQVIQFSHLSVKEFLTSDHLSDANDAISHYHISTMPAHTLVARVCLGILLHVPKDVTSDDLENFPLARYAAEYWVDHARFEDVSQKVEDGMKVLFDSRKSHLAVWTWIYDRTVSYWSRMKRGKTPSKPSKTALHYAAFYGLLRIVKHLITEHSQDVEAHGFGDKCTALYVALAQGHIEVARVLLGAVTTGKVGDGEHAELTQAQALLEHGAVATAQNENGWTPLHFASDRGYFDLARVLLQHDADATAQNENGWSPLHFASDRGDFKLAWVLFRHGAVATAQNENGSTPLHFAADRGYAELARLLIEFGAGPTAQNENGSTPLHFASDGGHFKLARFLLERGADPTTRDGKGQTPVSLASSKGHTELAQVLREHSAVATAQDAD